MIPKGITELPNGQWVLEQDSHISRWAEQHGNIITDRPLMNWLKPYLDAHGVTTVLDGGANIGDTSRAYLDWGYEVIAIEPNPLAFRCLQNNCPDATCINYALSDTDQGSLRFLQLDNVGASRIHPEGNIHVIPILGDSLLRTHKPPSFIKLDLEGHEMNALRGLEETIENHRPIILCEINRGALEANGFTAMDILNFFRKRGYSVDTLYPPQANLGWEQFDVLAIP